MLLVLTTLVHNVDGEAREQQELTLLKLANSWLQRKSDGIQDGLLLIGVDFPSPEELRKRVGPLGLGDADLEVVQLEEGEYLGEQVEPVLSGWLRAKHPSAVSFLNWKTLQGERAYPELDWWWTGVEAAPADELSSILEGMRKLLPADFKAQAPTWLELAMHDSPVGMFDSEQANFEVVMNALGVSRWLQAYDEVSENGYFNFDYQEAMKAFPVDLMRLGREAFQDNAEATAEAFDDEEATQDQLAAASLRVCLANRSSTLAHSLRKSFGSPTGLLWALYTSIWPALTKPMDEACGQLFSGHTVALGELMPQWQFVEEGWGNITEN